jgi:hypothetical protein
MNSSDLKVLSDQALVRQFRDYALEQGTAVAEGNSRRYNRLYRKIAAIDAELRARGPRARSALLALLNDSNVRVRFETARRCLAVDHGRALTALNEIIASHQMPEEAEAGMTLWNLQTGVLKPT